MKMEHLKYPEGLPTRQVLPKGRLGMEEAMAIFPLEGIEPPMQLTRISSGSGGLTPPPVTGTTLVPQVALGHGGEFV